MNDKVLRDDVAKMLGFLNKFAVGVKYDVFNIDLINDLAGTLAINIFKQFHPYIAEVREDYQNFYKDYEELVMELEYRRYTKDRESLNMRDDNDECYQFSNDFGDYLSNVFKR